jgi:hypothetical protein
MLSLGAAALAAVPSFPPSLRQVMAIRAVDGTVASWHGHWRGGRGLCRPPLRWMLGSGLWLGALPPLVGVKP